MLEITHDTRTSRYGCSFRVASEALANLIAIQFLPFARKNIDSNVEIDSYGKIVTVTSPNEEATKRILGCINNTYALRL